MFSRYVLYVPIRIDSSSRYCTVLYCTRTVQYSTSTSILWSQNAVHSGTGPCSILNSSTSAPLPPVQCRMNGMMAPLVPE